MSAFDEYADVRSLKPEQIAEITDGFLQFDTGRKGYITENEIRDTLQRSGIPAQAQEVDQVFQRLDVHRHGSIDYQDYLRGMAHAYVHPGLSHDQYVNRGAQQPTFVVLGYSPSYNPSSTQQPYQPSSTQQPYQPFPTQQSSYNNNPPPPQQQQQQQSFYPPYQQTSPQQPYYPPR
ncbi:unnamed protein product [Didymodactylos carnosus]|uniref:EF-hand domain-containing protein n=1 Tax=Didymodactylos carnosus TaxID=1234261 RepID=A0A814T7V2_9BILA|nr:unnamed protein product [Didymodactylos carnosus]CAF1158302.1 unnamed protein product [Didymodactylos carnosus]CAF3579423.1 unnamed protein product [Didymodactylos carnosus]CAF3921692.1 unnamed protein product [Didymodactylos carnosus]